MDRWMDGWKDRQTDGQMNEELRGCILRNRTIVRI